MALRGGVASTRCSTSSGVAQARNLVVNVFDVVASEYASGTMQRTCENGVSPTSYMAASSYECEGIMSGTYRHKEGHIQTSRCGTRCLSHDLFIGDLSLCRFAVSCMLFVVRCLFCDLSPGHVMHCSRHVSRKGEFNR